VTYQEEMERIQAETARIRRIHEGLKQFIAVRETKEAVQRKLASEVE
jgi:hypothetical protein